MTKRRVLLLGLLVLLIANGFYIWLQRPVPASVRLDLTGTAGLKVAGTLVVDGVTREFSGTLPTNITVAARILEYRVAMQEPRGELTVNVAAGGDLRASCGVADDFAGVQGHYSHTWRGRGVSATGSRKAP